MYLLLKKVWVTKNGYVQSPVSIIAIFRSSQGGGVIICKNIRKNLKILFEIIFINRLFLFPKKL